MSALPFKTCDIFCRVIDNYGDIGVCWRLARQLANEYPLQVRLWVDEIASLSKIWPKVTQMPTQQVENVEICIWTEQFSATHTADVVIEAFACNIPESYLIAMKQREIPSHWFNLEYLSAEEWVEGCHGLFSAHPQLGLKKAFYFPGFNIKTGGLIKESTLDSEYHRFLASPQAPIQFLNSLGVSDFSADLTISLFGYENSAIPFLLDAWAASSKSILCLVPPGKILPDIENYLGRKLAQGDEHSQGSLRIKVIPFINQKDYDKLLWCCDLNFVRGEDSFVRAQWAQKPFVWHIYPQDDDAHLTKLEAFLHLYLEEAPIELKEAVSGLFFQWNVGKDPSDNWSQCVSNLQNWQKHSLKWSQHLNSLGDLASNMVQFCQKTL